MGRNKPCQLACLGFTVVFLISCSQHTFIDERLLIEFLKDEENGYVQRKSVNGIDIELMYRPTDLLVMQELGDSISLEKIKILRDKYSQYLYFHLSMSKNDRDLLGVAPRNREGFGQMVNQLVFGMKDKVHLINSLKDTIQLVDYVYPRLYGMGKTSSMLFVFQRDEQKLNTSYISFTIQDFDLQTGEVNFKIDTRKVNKEPSIQFKN